MGPLSSEIRMDFIQAVMDFRGACGALMCAQATRRSAAMDPISRGIQMDLIRNLPGRVPPLLGTSQSRDLPFHDFRILTWEISAKVDMRQPSRAGAPCEQTCERTCAAVSKPKVEEPRVMLAR